MLRTLNPTSFTSVFRMSVASVCLQLMKMFKLKYRLINTIDMYKLKQVLKQYTSQQMLHASAIKTGNVIHLHHI